MLKNARTKSKKAFTLIELLVVVLILAILMVVSIPLYLSSVAESQRRTCRTNQRTIATAVEAARVKSMSVDYSSLIAGGANSSNLPDLSLSTPLCPLSGTYSLSNGQGGTVLSYKVSCSIATHGSFEPSIDKN